MREKIKDKGRLEHILSSIDIISIIRINMNLWMLKTTQSYSSDL